MKNNLLRIIGGIVLFIMVFYGPWWLFLFSALAFLFLFDNYYEAIVASVFFDALNGVISPRFSIKNFLFLISISCAFVLIIYIKRHLSFYSD